MTSIFHHSKKLKKCSTTSCFISKLFQYNFEDTFNSIIHSFLFFSFLFFSFLFFSFLFFSFLFFSSLKCINNTAHIIRWHEKHYDVVTYWQRSKGENEMRMSHFFLIRRTAIKHSQEVYIRTIYCNCRIEALLMICSATSSHIAKKNVIAFHIIQATQRTHHLKL